MTSDKDRKRIVRARMAEAGLPYTAALEQFRAEDDTGARPPRRPNVHKYVIEFKAEPVGNDPAPPITVEADGYEESTPSHPDIPGFFTFYRSSGEERTPVCSVPLLKVRLIKLADGA